jgi:type IV secretory pathway VirB10-like protein
VSPDRVQPPASAFVVQAGTVIPAALITGLRSDLPGQITAQVTEYVYDSPSGRYLLIPQGPAGGDL